MVVVGSGMRYYLRVSAGLGVGLIYIGNVKLMLFHSAIGLTVEITSQ